MRDFLEQEIGVGDTVVYPGRRGARLWMNRAIVKKVWHNGVKPRVTIETPEGQTTCLQSPERVVIVTRQLDK